MEVDRVPSTGTIVVPPSEGNGSQDVSLFMSSGAPTQPTQPSGTNQVAEIISALAQLDPDELDQVMQCPLLYGLYQIRPKVTMRRRGKVMIELGSPLGEQDNEMDQLDQESVEVTAPLQRARIQSNARIEDSDEESGQEVREEAQENELVEEEEAQNAEMEEDQTPGGTRIQRSTEADQGTHPTNQQETNETISLLNQVDNVALAPSTANATLVNWPYEWLDGMKTTVEAMTQLHRHFPDVHDLLEQRLRPFADRARELGNRICTLANAFAGSAGIAEVVEDLNRTLQTYPCFSGAIPTDSARGIIANVGRDMVESTTTAEDNQGPATAQALIRWVPGSAPTGAAHQLRELLERPSTTALYHQIQQLDASRYAHTLRLRLSLATLACRFETEVASTSGRVMRRREVWNKAKVTAAKDKMFGELVPGASRRSASSVAEARRFERRLEQGQRWLQVARRFGFGALVMIPSGFPESRWQRELPSSALKEIFFWFVEQRYPRPFNLARLEAVLVGFLTNVYPVGVPVGPEALEKWLVEASGEI